ncbi:hypothetical protein GGX14DRAFT_558761 [Mycena pura]|uniref:Uncharacterized protein n=1 Tax=Mycena pura TaxID=153505 RepID=A0AAD6YK46_9AGAR|nr:hypothetical protein GGX14DRAFT_558761 [Mycena pura]
MALFLPFVCTPSPRFQYASALPVYHYSVPLLPGVFAGTRAAGAITVPVYAHGTLRASVAAVLRVHAGRRTYGRAAASGAHVEGEARCAEGVHIASAPVSTHLQARRCRTPFRLERIIREGDYSARQWDTQRGTSTDVAADVAVDLALWRGQRRRSREDMPLADDNAMKNLVCEHCWSTVFSPDAFPAMREIPSDSDQWYKEGGFKYETVSWTQLQEVAKLCQFCGIVCSAITQAVVTPLTG